MGGIRIETSEGGLAVSTMLLCTGIQESLYFFKSDRDLSEEHKIVLREGIKFLSQVVMGSLAEDSESLLGSSGLLPREDISVFDSLTPFHFAKLELNKPKRAIRYSQNFAFLLHEIVDNGKKFGDFSKKRKEGIEKCEVFFDNLCSKISEKFEKGEGYYI